MYTYYHFSRPVYPIHNEDVFFPLNVIIHCLIFIMYLIQAIYKPVCGYLLGQNAL